MNFGYVLWFDSSSGEGEIYCNHSKKIYYVHYSAIISKDKFKDLSKGQKVELTLYTNLYMSQIDTVEVISEIPI